MPVIVSSDVLFVLTVTNNKTGNVCIT